MATTNDIILEILNNAAAAHGVYETEVLGGVHDAEWPEWYAEHMTQELEELSYRIVPASA